MVDIFTLVFAFVFAIIISWACLFCLLTFFAFVFGRSCHFLKNNWITVCDIACFSNGMVTITIRAQKHKINKSAKFYSLKKIKINTLFPHLSQNISVINNNMYFSQVKMKTTFELI